MKAPDKKPKEMSDGELWNLRTARSPRWHYLDLPAALLGGVLLFAGYAAAMSGGALFLFGGGAATIIGAWGLSHHATVQGRIRQEKSEEAKKEMARREEERQRRRQEDLRRELEADRGGQAAAAQVVALFEEAARAGTPRDMIVKGPLKFKSAAKPNMKGLSDP